MINAEVQLINGFDIELARRHIIGQEEIKSIWTTMLVDTGAVMLAINENIQAQLQIPVVEKRRVQLANSHIHEYDVVAPVEVRFKNRRTICQALVLPGDSEPLLGAIPMEDMDVIISPARQELIVHPDHPYFAVVKMKGCRGEVKTADGLQTLTGNL
jgi:clan AA aspartic protease